MGKVLGQTETNIVVPICIVVPVPLGRTTIVIVVVPSATTQHATTSPDILFLNDDYYVAML